MLLHAGKGTVACGLRIADSRLQDPGLQDAFERAVGPVDHECRVQRAIDMLQARRDSADWNDVEEQV